MGAFADSLGLDVWVPNVDSLDDVSGEHNWTKE